MKVGRERGRERGGIFVHFETCIKELNCMKIRIVHPRNFTFSA